MTAYDTLNSPPKGRRRPPGEEQNKPPKRRKISSYQAYAALVVNTTEPRPPLSPVALATSNREFFFMPEDPDYELVTQLKAIGSVSRADACHRCDLWTRVRDIPDLEQVQSDTQSDRRDKIFGNANLAERLIEQANQMRDQAGNILSFSERADNLPQVVPGLGRRVHEI